METYRTEEEQLEQLKNWLRENGRSLVLGIVIAVAAVFGWRAWQDHQRNQEASAALNYQNLLEAMHNIDQSDEPAVEMLATANTLADALKTEHARSGYAQLAALIKARLLLEKEDAAAAEEELRWVLAQKPKPELAALTRLRLAKVLLARGEPDAALAQLQQPGGYAFAYAHVRGDVLHAKGDAAGARAAYEEAQRLGRELQPPFDDPVLELKLRDLRPSTADALPADQAES